MSLAQVNPNGTALICVQWVFTALSLSAVYLRLVARRVTRAGMVFSDWAIILAQVCAFGYSVAGTVSVVMGHGGQDVSQVAPQQLRVFGMAMVTQEIIWLTATTCIKLSILHFLYMLFRRKARFLMFLYPLMALVAASWVAFFVGGFWACKPFAANWDLSLHGDCSLREPIWLASSIFSLCFDLAIFVLPIPVVVGLQMRRARKLAVIGVFGVGLAVCVVAAMRLLALYHISTHNPTRASPEIGIWSILDTTLGIVNACMPLLPPALSHLYGRDLLAWARRTLPSSRRGPSARHASAARSASKPRSDSPYGDAASLRRPSRQRSDTDPEFDFAPPLPLAATLQMPRTPRAHSPPAFDPDPFFPPDRRPAASSRQPSSGAVSQRPSSPARDPDGSDAAAAAALNTPAAPVRRGSSCALANSIANRVATRVASRIASRADSRSASRVGRRHDDDDGAGRVEMQQQQQQQWRRRSSTAEWDGAQEKADDVERGITVTTTWGVNVESLEEVRERFYGHGPVEEDRA